MAWPSSISHWSLRTLQTSLIKVGAKVVKHARFTCFRMAEVSISRNLFAAILRRIRRLIQPVPVRRPDPVNEINGRFPERERKDSCSQTCVAPPGKGIGTPLANQNQVRQTDFLVSFSGFVV
ncbi:MAG: transposase [SAR324 cluster bacterium]|nr:transposase [SAR324 cluster bacterium]